MKYLILLLALACTSTGELQSKILIIGDHLVDCTGVGPQKCMLVKDSQEADWTYFYDHIKGFDYEPGFTYEIIVSETEIDNPAADASSIQYTLKEIISKTPAPSGADLMREWTVLKLKGLDQLSSAPTLIFKEEDQKLGGFAGCNNYFSTYHLNGQEIKIDQAGATRKLCPDMSVEDVFFKLLPEVARYEVVKKELYLYNISDEVLIIAMSN